MQPWDLARIAEVFRLQGGRAYAGEPVSQAEHALQAAWLAEQEGADDAQITAALLHDVGHLIVGLPGSPTQDGIDDRHQLAAMQPLALFPEAVLAPIRLHVDAKRYLCRGDYQDALSPDSMRSLMLQGGPMTDEEADRFTRTPHSAAAVALRLRDDRAKVRRLHTPDLAHFLHIAARALHTPL